MQQIRKFEEERKAWESERNLYEQREQALADEKWQAEQELLRLNGEMEQLRAAKAEAAGARQQGPVQPTAPMRSHHESQLALMSMIDDLRRELRDEQVRARALEQKSLEAEKTNRRLSAELDKAREGNSPSFLDLDCSVRTITKQFSQKGFMDLDSSVRSVGVRQLTGKASSGSAGSGEERDELSETLHTLQASRNEVLSLEDETLRLREELNGEKKKVIDLKKAAHSRAAAWKEELHKITEELNGKQQLEEEVAQLRLEQARCHKELGLLQGREAAVRREASKLQKELEGHAASKKGAREEMELLSSVVGGQLVAVEQELTQQMMKSSQLFEHFLCRARDPLTSLRRSSRRIASSGAAGRMLASRSAPPAFDTDVHDLPGSLSKIVDLLRFAAEVLEAQEQQQEFERLGDQRQQQPQHPQLGLSLSMSPPLHKRDPVMREESSGFAADWMRAFR